MNLNKRLLLLRLALFNRVPVKAHFIPYVKYGRYFNVIVDSDGTVTIKANQDINIYKDDCVTYSLKLDEFAGDISGEVVKIVIGGV